MVIKTERKGQLGDFGVKLGGARKDRVLSAEKVIHDDEIANMTLSQIWPKSEIDDINDIDMASLATAIRAEIPAKPKMKYKLDRWVEGVKLMRWFMKYTNEHGFEPTMERIKQEKNGVLMPLIYRVNTLRQLPREHWGRIEEVNYYPDAHAFDENRNVVTKPYADARVDGRSVGAASLEALIEAIRERLNVDKQQATIRFEIRGHKDNYYINKKGDPLYRKLKTFSGEDAIKQARAYMDQNKPDLLKAWEAVKEAENVKETDVRREENRPRVGKDHRQGRNATPEMFMDAFGFRGVEFGNWVSQGANLKERQGMLNAAYDALMDLANVIGVSPRWISLNGELGLGLGSRGSGSASAHFEPTTVVINLTKTRGAGTMAHEWFHAVDNHFQRKRGKGKGRSREDNYITFAPGAYYIHKATNTKVKAARFNELKDRHRINNPDDWEIVDGIPSELSAAFDSLVKTLDESPMAKRSRRIDKGQSGGYWGRVNERASRAFENHIIAKMISQGYHNDYLANVVTVDQFRRDPDNYPYLLENEIEPVSKAFDGVFEAIKKHEPKSTEPYEPKIAKKEPWEMSKAEFVSQRERETRQGYSKISGLAPSIDNEWRRRTGGAHEQLVMDALSEGKPVSPDVLKDYPELTKKATIAPEVLEKAREYDKKHPEGITSMSLPDHKITDVTPEGYGPTETKNEAKARIKNTMQKYHSGALVREVVTKTEGPVILNTGHLTQEQLRNKMIETQNKQIDARRDELKEYEKREGKDVKATGIRVIENTRELKVTNLDMLPRGTGAPYLEVIESHVPGEYIAKAVRRKLPDKGSGIFIHMGKPEAKPQTQPAEKGREPYSDKDEEEYYAEFAESREGTAAPGSDEYKDIEAPAAVKAELKASIKEGKAIDKSAEAVVKEAEKIIDKTPEPEPAVRSHLKTMSYEDRMMYREVVERRLEDVQRMTREMSQEAEGIKEFIDSDPVATYRGTKYGQKVGLIYLLKGGQFPDTVTRKQAQMILMGRELKPNAFDSKGRVRWEYVLDELADHFKMSEQELIDHVENIAEQKDRLKDMDILISEAADREKELQRTMDELNKYDKITGGAPTEYATPFIRQTPGEPEAGVQKGMLGEDKEVRPQGKGKVVQVNLMDYGKLQEIKAAVKKPADLDADIMAEVRKIQENRSPRSIAGDNAQTAKNVVKGEDIKKWIKHPERYDIRGVDTKRVHRPRGTARARIRTSR